MKIRLAILLALPVLCACFPVHYLVRPGISGSIVDDSTSMPVADATVILRRIGGSNGWAMTTPSGKDRHFALASRRAWGVYMVPEDVFDYVGAVDIYASGYIRDSRDVRAKSFGNTEPIVLGEVRVKRPL